MASSLQQQRTATTTTGSPPAPQGDKKTFEVALEGTDCRIIVNDVLLPTEASLKHSTAPGGCHCVEPDRVVISAWMFWVAHMCITHGLISKRQANALLDLTRSDLRLPTGNHYKEEEEDEEDDEKVNEGHLRGLMVQIQKAGEPNKISAIHEIGEKRVTQNTDEER